VVRCSALIGLCINYSGTTGKPPHDLKTWPVIFPSTALTYNLAVSAAVTSPLFSCPDSTIGAGLTTFTRIPRGSKGAVFFTNVSTAALSGPVAILASDGDIMNQVNAAIQFYDQTCNINMIFTGICHTAVPAPSAGLTVNCSASGFLNDFWLAGSYFEFATATCQYLDGFRRVIGYGSEIVVFIVQNVTPDTPNNAIGCSFASTHNYVVVEADSTVSNFAASHEIGHACLLPHSSGTNLMNTSVPFTNPTLTALQIAVVRWSKHCVYF
jgi:hypothetical protein